MGLQLHMKAGWPWAEAVVGLRLAQFFRLQLSTGHGRLNVLGPDISIPSVVTQVEGAHDLSVTSTHTRGETFSEDQHNYDLITMMLW